METRYGSFLTFEEKYVEFLRWWNVYPFGKGGNLRLSSSNIARWSIVTKLKTL